MSTRRPDLKLKDTDGTPVELVLLDNADSISLELSVSVSGAVAHLDIRLGSKELDTLEAEIRSIRQHRGL